MDPSEHIKNDIFLTSTPKDTSIPSHTSAEHILELTQVYEALRNKLSSSKKNNETLRQLSKIYELAEKINDEYVYYKTELTTTDYKLKTVEAELKRIRKAQLSTRLTLNKNPILKHLSEHPMLDASVSQTEHSARGEKEVMPSQGDEPPASGKIKINIPKYQDFIGSTYNLLDIVNIIDSLIKRRGTGDSEERNKYMQLLRQEILELEKTVQEYKVKHSNIQILDQVLRDQKQQLQDYQKMLEETATRERENADKLQMCKTQLEEKESILEEYIDRDNEQVTKTNMQVLMHKLHKLEKLILSSKQQGVEHKIDHEISNQQPASQETSGPNIAPRLARKNPTQLSRSAIIIRRSIQTNISMTDLRNLLMRNTKDRLPAQKVFCYNGRNRNVLIIRSTSDADVDMILKELENTPSLKDIIQLTYKATNTKKLIILGIPNDMPEGKITEHINSTYQTETEIDIVKLIKRKDSKNYQMVVEVEDWLARHLLKQRKITMGFLQCKIAPYLPVVRCNNCQRYGHTKEVCGNGKICSYCAKPHCSTYCPVKNNSNKHRCFNCMGTSCDFPHTADSPDCPAFHYFIQQRNTLAKTSPAYSVS